MLKVATGSLSVVNTRNGVVGIYIGRAGYGNSGSALANPFKAASKTVTEHDRVVALYKRWLWDHIQAKDPAVCSELQELLDRYTRGEDVLLRCWCKPLPCHGDVVKACIEWAFAAHHNFY